MNLTLYGTTGCHLCDEAEDLLRVAAASMPLTWEYVDIALDPDLVERMGPRIPVLASKPSGRVLDWPFSLLDIRNIHGEP